MNFTFLEGKTLLTETIELRRMQRKSKRIVKTMHNV